MGGGGGGLIQGIEGLFRVLGSMRHGSISI